MALMDNIKSVLGFPRDDEYIDDEYQDSLYEDDDVMEEEPVFSRRNRGMGRRASEFFSRDESPSYEETRRPQASSSSAQMVLVKAKRYAEVDRIAENLKQRRSVIINFSEMESAEAQRVIDFLSGATFAMNGAMQRVSKSTFIFAVGQVDLVGRIEESKEKGNSFTF